MLNCCKSRSSAKMDELHQQAALDRAGNLSSSLLKHNILTKQSSKVKKYVGHLWGISIPGSVKSDSTHLNSFLAT